MKKGFTLIELLVVVLIIGILAAIALPQYTTAVNKSRAAEALSMLGSIRYAAERYRLQTNNWPTDLTTLDIEVPTSSNFTYAVGGAGTAAATNFVVKATATKGGTYVINYAVDATGAFQRCCGTAITTDTKTCTAATAGTPEAKICNAISSGSPTNF